MRMISKALCSALLIVGLEQGQCRADELFSYSDANSDIFRVSFSPDGQLLAVGIGDGRIRVFNTKTWKETTRFNLHPDDRRRPVWALSIAADSKSLIAGYLVVKQWSLPDGKLLKEYGELPEGVVTSISAEAGLCCKSLQDATILICDLKSQKTIRTLKGHKVICLRTAFGPKPDLLATAGFDLAVKTWDVEKGKELANITGHEYGLVDVAWSPDGKEIATASWDGIRIIDVEKKGDSSDLEEFASRGTFVSGVFAGRVENCGRRARRDAHGLGPSNGEGTRMAAVS